MRVPIIVVTLASLGLLRAEPAAVEGTLSLSLKRAVEIALAPDGSPRVALAVETVKQAESRQAVSRGALLPDLESSINDQRQTENLRAFGFNFKIPVPGFSFP